MLLTGCGAGSLDDSRAQLQDSPSASPTSASETTPSPTPSPSPSPSPPAIVDGAGAGKALAETETAIRSPSTPPGELAALGRRQQVLYRTLVATPAWRADALAQLPPALVPVASANIEAGAELRALTRPQQSLPLWRIVEPPPANELLAHYKQAETEFGIPWQYLASIHLVESRLGRIRGTSPAGAQGPMQFIPSTWARYGRGDINSPLDSILAAGRYLKAAGAPGNMARALYAYNHSDRYVKAITLYAEQMIKDERAWLGYYHWQVYYRTVNGDVELPVGYGS